MDYTFHYAHRSGAHYLVSLEKRDAADAVGSDEWQYRWRVATVGAPWVEWNTLDVPPTASLDRAVARAKDRIDRLYQTGDHRAPGRADEQEPSGPS